MYGAFNARADKVMELMRDEETGFVVVTAPDRRSLQEAGYFVDRLDTGRMHLVGVVVNRWHQAPKLRVSSKARERLATGRAVQRASAACVEHAEPLRMAEARGHAAV